MGVDGDFGGRFVGDARRLPLPAELPRAAGEDAVGGECALPRAAGAELPRAAGEESTAAGLTGLTAT